jgi:hypothetical protein
MVYYREILGTFPSIVSKYVCISLLIIQNIKSASLNLSRVDDLSSRPTDQLPEKSGPLHFRYLVDPI